MEAVDNFFSGADGQLDELVKAVPQEVDREVDANEPWYNKRTLMEIKKRLSGVLYLGSTQGGRTTRLRGLIAAGVMVAAAIAHFVVYGLSFERDAVHKDFDGNLRFYVDGTLHSPETLKSRARATLHNRTNIVVDSVVLFIGTGSRRKCAPKEAGCTSSGYSKDVPTVTDKGWYKCTPAASALPDVTFECEFVSPFYPSDERGFEWYVHGYRGRPVDPLRIYSSH